MLNQTNLINQTAAQAFLDVLAPGEKITFQIFNDKKGGGARTIHGRLSDLLPTLNNAQKRGRGIFATIQATDGSGRRTAANITGLRAVFVDLDYYKDPSVFEKSPLPPHIVVSSGRGLHAYWLLLPGQDLEQFRAIQKQLIQFFSEYGADPAVHDLARVMRLPGSVHLKEKPLPVEILTHNNHPRYTLEEIKAAFPALARKEKESKTVYELPEISSTDEYQWRYDMTRLYIEAIARNTGDGNRHNPGLSAGISIASNGLRPDHAEDMMLYFCALSGLPQKEGLSILNWAQQKGLKSRLKSPKLKRRRPQPKMDFKPLNEARQELNEKLYLIVQSLEPGLTVIKATPGVGKTTASAVALWEMIETKAWPMVGNKRAKILFLTDSHKLAEDMAEKTQTPPAEVYQGRSKLCVQHEVIDGQANPGSYCKSMCTVRKQGLCSYYINREKVMKRDFIIAPKQAFLNNYDQLKNFDLVIVDESLSDYLQSRVTLDIGGLKELVKAIKAANIDPKEHDAALAFVSSLIDEIADTREGERVLRRKPPTVEVKALERALTGPDGRLIKAPAFWSLLEHSHRIRVDYEKSLIHITCDNSPLADALATLPVINLDATPIPELLQRFKPEYLNFDVKQNYKLYQGTRFKFSRAMWRRNKYQDMGIDLTRQIISACKGSVAVFGFKDKLAVLEAATGAPGVKYGAYGADSKGTNEYEGIENIILTGLFTPNVSAMNDIAAVAGVKADKLITQKQDAEIAQTIGRARAVNALKPVNVFVLSNHALKVEKKPQSISQFLAENKPQNTNERIDRYRCQDKDLSYIKTLSSTKDTSPRRGIAQVIKDALTPIESIKRKIKRAVQHCIDTHGFYAHDLLGYGAGRLSQVRALQGVKAEQHKRYIGAVLHEMGLERHSLQIDVGVHIAVWGSLDAAVELITCPDELEAAKQHVQRVYRQSGGALALCQTANALGLTVQVLDLMREQNFKAHNWAVLVHKKHLRDREYIPIE
ncbi:MAG: hypothetical protein IE914_06135 [Thiotrichales bacterium]|nr:hypothetical protein [Thiotrichales bacterium]